MPTYVGVDVLELKPNRPGPVQEGLHRAHEVFDTKTGERWTDALEAAPVGDRPFVWPCFGRAAALAQRAWIDARRGVVVPFWAPSWEPDLTLYASPGSGADTIQIERIRYAELVWAASAARRHVAVYVRGQPVSYHYVTTAVDSGLSYETLTIYPATPVAWPVATTKISFLRYCRMDQPFVERRWLGGGFCVAEIPYVEIPLETPVES